MERVGSASVVAGRGPVLDDDRVRANANVGRTSDHSNLRCARTEERSLWLELTDTLEGTSNEDSSSSPSGESAEAGGDQSSGAPGRPGGEGQRSGGATGCRAPRAHGRNARRCARTVCRFRLVSG